MENLFILEFLDKHKNINTVRDISNILLLKICLIY